MVILSPQELGCDKRLAAKKVKTERLKMKAASLSQVRYFGRFEISIQLAYSKEASNEPACATITPGLLS